MDTLLLFLVVFSLSACSALDYRLPDTITPSFYDLHLHLDPTSNEYNGTVNITLRTSTDSDEIHIHEDGDSITIGSVILNNNVKCYPGIPNEVDISVINCTRSLIVDEDNSLYIEFSGKFFEEEGLVKSKIYEDEIEEVMIESNFQPTFARRAFPCFDEPHLKANFSVTITHPSDYSVISNSPAVDATRSDGSTTTKFANTPAISPYLLSIFVSQLKEVKTPEVENVDYRIYTRPEVAEFSGTANNYYPQIIAKLGEYSGIPYENLSDIESYLIAVPDSSDDMGGFGLFAYRESDLLDEGDKTTNIVKQNIIKTMAYKASHEWYGGDIATEWWSDIWANEAVATYLQYVIGDEVEDGLELTNQFLLEVTQKNLQTDAYSSAQALASKESEVNDDWAIENKLNTLNYEKGSSILHMISQILEGKDNFQSSLQAHWQNRKDTETDTADLINDLLAGKTDRDVDYNTVFQKWLYSPGYPLITVKLKESNETDIATVTQKRFVYPTEEVTIEDNEDWYIPLTTVNRANQQAHSVDVFLQPDDDMMYFFGHGSWLVFNSLGSSFYRVNYDEELWGRIIDGLKTNRSAFHVLQRSQLVDDIFNVARIGDVGYSLAIEIADLLVNETEYYPWYSTFNAFAYLLDVVEDEGVKLKIKNYILDLMDSMIVIPKSNFVDENDSHVEVLKKVMVLKWACNLGHEGCITYAREKFEEYKKTPSSLEDYNLREAIFCTGIKYSENTQEDHTYLWNIFKNASSVHLKDDILKAIGCSEDQSVLQSHLERILELDHSTTKRQDDLVILKSVLSSSLGLQVAMDFLQNNSANIQSLHEDMRDFSEMVYLVAEKLASDDQIIWLRNLLNDPTFENYEDIKSKAIVLASVNNYWRKHFQPDLVNIFPAPVTPSSSTTTESDGHAVAVSKYVLPFVLLIFALFK